MRVRALAIRLRPAVLVCSALVAVGALHAQPRMFKAGSGPDELWDVTMKMEMPGMPMAMPAQTSQVCLKKDRNGEDLVPKQENCRVYDVRTSGNRVTFAIECTGKEPMTGTGEVTSTPTSYEGRMHVKAGRRGEQMEMTQTFAGRRIGACTDQSAQTIASVQAQSNAEVAKACAAGMESLQPAIFFAKGSACAPQQKAFCDKVGGLARDMREPAGFRAVTVKIQAEQVGQAFAACNQDFTATTKAACGKASSTRDWAFVGGGSCDDDVLSAGAIHCKGRDYYTVDRSLTSLCNRYARLTRGTTASSGVPAQPAPPQPVAQPAPSKASDPLQQGVDAVRKLLPF